MTPAFWTGFISKCASLNVDPVALIKIAKLPAPAKPTLLQDYYPSYGGNMWQAGAPGSLLTQPEKHSTKDMVTGLDSAISASLANKGSAIQNESYGGIGSLLGTLLGAGGGGALGHHLGKGDPLAVLGGSTGGAGLGNLLGRSLGRSFVSENPDDLINTYASIANEGEPVSGGDFELARPGKKKVK